jgi:sulfide:quinone oxidoreductase
VPVVGPFALLQESRANHLGKLGFRWAYWNLLLRGRPMPVPTLMSMAGKRPET